MNQANSLARMVVLLLALAAQGCSKFVPGNEGWFCQSSSDCREGLRCVAYRFEHSRDEIKLCTGAHRLQNTSENYGWIFLAVGWLFCAVLPAGVALLIIGRKLYDAARRSRK